MTIARISKPGLYYDFEEDRYHNDPCPEPSFTQSIGKILLERSPKHAWIAHPRLNPNFKPDTDKKFDIGSVAHKILLGRGRDVKVLEFDDYRTKAAQQQREEAIAAGLQPILQEQFERAAKMAMSVREQLIKHEANDAFIGGHAEVMAAWEQGWFWYRSLIDYLHNDNCIVDDFKTTAKSVAPHTIGYMMADAGWPIQAATIERGLNNLHPETAGKRRFRFIVAENEEPFGITVVELSESVMTMGRKQLQAAEMIWKTCLDRDRWPGYPNRIVMPEYAGFKEAQWLEREISGEFDPANLMAG